MDEGMTAIAEGQTMSVEQAPEPAVNENELPGNDKQFDETQETEGEGEEGAEGEGGEQTPQEPEETEVEFNGKKYKVHPDLKDGLMMRADHTRKTMEVAELRKAVEAKQAEVAAAFSTSQEVLQAKAHMLNIDGA
ncbi:MAG: hypothetical protein AAAC47_28970, partial [Pararhizobium sp.]